MKRGEDMYRTETRQWLQFGAVALAFLVSVSFLIPAAMAEDICEKDDEGAFVDRGSGGWTDERAGGGGQNDSDDDGDSTDPDWFEFTSWSTQRLVTPSNRTMYGSVNPFDRVVNWLLLQVSSQYLRLW